MKLRMRLIIIILTTVALILLMQLFFFINFHSWEQKTADSMFQTSVRQTTAQIENLAENVKNIVFKISTDVSVQNGLFNYTPQERIRNQIQIESNIAALFFGENRLHYVTIISNNMTTFSASQNTAYLESEMKSPNAIALEISQNTHLSDSTGIFTEPFPMGDKMYFAYIERIYPVDINIQNTMDKYIVAMFCMNLDTLYPENYAKSQDFITLLANDKGNIIDSSNKEYLGMSIDEFEEKNKGNFLKKGATIEGLNWEIVCAVPAKSIIDMRPLTTFLLIIAAIVTILVIFVMSFMLTRMISVSINRIKSDINVICRGNWNYRLKVTDSSELGSIAADINYMLDIMDMINKEKEAAMEQLHQAELLQQRTTINYLQNQISPHFLYNSMEHIRGIALEKQIPEISNVAAILSKTFRYAQISSSIATVGEDLDTAFDYFNVINLRRKEPVEINFMVSDKYLDIPIIRMVFQPIFENIMKHGLRGVGDGYIDVHAWNKDDILYISITDNGKGMKQDALEKLQGMLDLDADIDSQSKAIGLLNVNRRLKLYYGKNFGISVSTPKNGGFCTTVRIKNSPDKM